MSGPEECRRPVIGLAGGVASGKSLVATQLADLGCVVIDADRMGHALLEEPAVRQRVRERFGEKVFAASAKVDRRALGREVFADRKNLEALNTIIHPELWQRVRAAVAEARRRSDARAVVLDAALIFEKGLDNLCEVMVYIKVPEAVRHARAKASRGWDSDEVARREAMQESLKAKRRRADYVIDNSVSPEHTLEQVRQILSHIVK